MRRVLFTACLVLLPIVGLGTGIWLTPIAMPLWKKEFRNLGYPLGFAGSEQTLLVAEVDIEGKHFLAGIHPVTGNELFRHSLAPKHLQARLDRLDVVALSDNGQYVLIPVGILDEERFILLYDWREHRVVERFRVPLLCGYCFQLTMKGNMLVISTDKGVYRWDKGNAEVAAFVKTTVTGNVRHYFVFIDPAKVISGHYHFYAGSRQTNVVTTDLANKTESVERIPSMNVEIILPSDSAGIHTLEWEVRSRMEPAYYVVRTYGYNQVGSLKRVGQDRELGAAGSCTINADNLFIINKVMHHPWRWKLRQQLGERFSAWFPFLSSEDESLHVYDIHAMKKLYQLTFPDGYLPSFGGTARFLVNRSHPGVAVYTPSKLDYWQLQPISRYFPMLGLLAGASVSVAIYIRALQRRRAKAL
jgi:hypothetical protein